MEDRLRFIKHKERDILLIDLCNASKQDLLDVLVSVQETVSEHPRDSVLILADFAGTHIDKEVATRIKEVLVLDRPYVKRAAWVGTEGVPAVFYENFKAFSRRDFPTFDTREEAMEWLVSE